MLDPSPTIDCSVPTVQTVSGSIYLNAVDAVSSFVRLAGEVRVCMLSAYSTMSSSRQYIADALQ